MSVGCIYGANPVLFERAADYLTASKGGRQPARTTSDGLN
jgi:hypothetical protein